MSMRRLAVLIAAALVLIAMPIRQADSDTPEACTDGTDCFCDCIENPGSTGADDGLYANTNCKNKYGGVGTKKHDTTAIFKMCEDYENPDFQNHTTASNGWADSGGSSTNRGNQSAWTLKYGNGVPACAWINGQPTTPITGIQCTEPSGCTGNVEWTSGVDLNPTGGCYDMFNNTDETYSSEAAGLGTPDTIGTSDNRGVWDGSRSVRWRNPVGQNSMGVVGEKSWSVITEIGVTFMTAYPDNILSSNVITAAWKNEELNYGGGAQEFWIFGGQNTELGGAGNQGGPWPFGGFLWSAGKTHAQAVLLDSTAVETVGSVTPNSGGAANAVYLTSANFTQSTDWPVGDWVCVKAHISGIAAAGTNTRVRKWVGDSQLVFDVTLRAEHMEMQGITGYAFNIYANRGISESIDIQANRNQDNWVVVNGEPVPCAELGYGAVAGSTPGSQGSGSYSIVDLTRDLFHIPEPFTPWPDKRAALAWARANHHP